VLRHILPINGKIQDSQEFHLIHSSPHPAKISFTNASEETDGSHFKRISPFDSFWKNFFSIQQTFSSGLPDKCSQHQQLMPDKKFHPIP
jgi:hypothetical protein